MMNDNAAPNQPNPQPPQFSVDEYVPPQAAIQSSTSPISQTLEEQNIFFLLGVTEATEAEKEAFLDELQQVIWEDFLANDVELLVTEEEMDNLKKIMQKSDLSEEQRQEEIVIFLEKLVPDLEEIMLEKALELKEDMMRERIAGMQEYFAGKDQQQAQLSKALELVEQEMWRDAAEMLNTISD